MINQWQAQYIIHEQDALKIINAQFPELHARTIELLGVGWDNTAYIINNEFVFRFPRRASAVALLQHEMAALPIIAQQVNLTVPYPEWQGKPTQDYPWPFSGYTMLPGSTADRMNLSDEKRIQLAKPIAQFLARLHAITSTQSSLATLPKDFVFQRLGLDYLIPAVTSNLAKVAVLQLLEHKVQLYHILSVAHLLRPPTNSTLVHGDVYCRHLLVDDTAKLTGIIDWGDVQLADSALDLAIAHSFLPPLAHEAFKASYGFISEETWNLARFRALHHSLLLILYGHDIHDVILVREGTRALQYIAEQV
jgi:aminoglycoside phosphotransferase (APT) family kinase protein